MMNLSILIFILAIISTCISAVALADIQSNNTNVILNHILSTNNNDNCGTTIAQQQLSCNETTIQIYGMYPMKGSELGNTPVALAVQIDSNNNNDDDIREKLNCNFGSTIQPLINGTEMNDQLERIAFAINNSSYANNTTQLGSNYELLLCISPPATSIGHIPFHISCNQEEEHQTSSSIIQSTLQFEYTIATSVHTIHPSLGTPNYTTVTITGSGYTNGTYLSCFFGRDHRVSAMYISSEEVQCDVPSSLPLQEGEGRDEYPIFISNNGIDYEDESWSTVSFIAVPLPVVQSVESNTITWSTDSNVTLIGLHFNPHASSKAVCSFDFGSGDNTQLTSVGVVVNDTQINCPIPVLQEDDLVQSSPFIGNIRISTNDGIDYSTSYSSSIFIYGPLSLQSVHPNSASLESERTNITLYGTNFHPSKTLSCLFTLVNDYVIPIPAAYHSSSKVTCQTPQAMMVGVAQLSVSTSNQDMSNSVDFTFLSLPTLISATPLSSSWSGGTIVTIQGSGFNNDDSLGSSTYCQFGNTLVVANVLNSTTLTCVTPPVTLVRHDVSSYEELDSLLDGIDITLEVSTNGHVTNSGITIQYTGGARIDAQLLDSEDEVDTHQIDNHPTNVQVTSFSPTFGSEEGGTIIHLVCTGFDNEEVSPHCVFNGGESTVATVISHTLIKCIVPSADIGQTSTSVGLSFNGDDLVLADTVFSYVSSPTITNISPQYISSSGGSKLTISGTNFTLDEHLVGVWKCSFGGTVVAASTTSEGDIVCFAPPIHPGVVEVRVSMNGVDFTAHSVKVISHLPAEIYNYVLQDDDMVMVNGINFQPSPGMSCIFNIQDVQIAAVATWESDTQVTCSIPPIVVGATSATLEISNTNEHHLDNPSISFHCPQLDESLPSDTLEELTKESEADKLDTKYSMLIDSAEPKAISEVGGELLTIHIVSDLQLGADLSCAFADLATSKTKTSPASAVISKYANNGKRSTLVVCPTPEMVPGEYTLSLNGINGKVTQDMSATITVYPESSVLEETSKSFNDVSTSDNNTDIRQLDELGTLSINIHPSFGPESGGNTVMIRGSGFKEANSSVVCRFGEDSVTPAKFISGESLECVAPPVVNHPVVNVSLTIDGVEWASSSSQTYTYLPMIRINEISPSSLQIDVPHKVIITGDNFEYMPFQLMCKLGTTILSNATTVDESSVTCFIPPIYQPGEVTLDLVIEEDGTSMLEPNSSNNTIKFHIPIDYSVFPSFADMTGGTNVIITNNNLAKDVSKQLMCQFNLNDDTSIDVVATPLGNTRYSCITPNVNEWSIDDDPIYATVFLLSEDGHDTSIPFMFKTTPMIESIYPSIGSVNGNTLVRVRGSSSMWVNSTLLTCLFGEQEVRAIFVSANIVDCVSPPGHGTVAVRVSDNNNVNLPKSPSKIYVYNEDPFVSSVTPSFGLTSDNNVITLFGSGFANRMELSCMFQGSSGSTHQVKGSFINETAMECYVGSDVLPSSQYVCRASNNGGIEYGGFNTTIPVHYTSLASPTIISIYPSSGIAGEPINVSILGTDLSVGSSSSPTHCVLSDHDGLRVSSSLAEVQSDELIHCLIHCPSLVNAKTKYTLGISLGDSDQVHSSSSFWCKPRARVLDILPKYISVGESTLININLGEFRPSSTLNCVFGDGHEMMPATYVANGVVQCLSPVFNHPHSLALSLSADNVTITEEVEIDVVDPISISRSISPKILFGGTDVMIEGNNFIPDEMTCTFGDSIGEIVTSNDTHVVCRPPIDVVSTSAEVVLSINGAPQLNASAGYVEILPPPRVDKITPSSSLALGGASVIIYGANFYDISNPICYFDDAIVKAYVLTDMTMMCTTPERNDAGEVSVQVSLDGGRSVQGGDVSFSFLSPVVLHEVYPQVVINGTQITLVGEGFTKSPIQCAFGDSTFTPATVLSSTEITCMFASNNEDFGQISVSIESVDSIPLSISNIVVGYHPRVEIYSKLHLYGSIMGGDILQLQVYGILDDIIIEEKELGLVHCQFGDKYTLATIDLDELIVSCSTPAADSPSNVSLSLTYGGLPFSSNALVFEYTIQPKVESIHPTSGPLAGGTSVRIQGLNLQCSISSCRFGSIESYGYMDSENTIVCISPATSSASNHAISLLLDPSKQWLDTGIDFHYIEPFIVESVQPLSIDRGVEFIRVNGRGYSRSTDLQCCFGETSDCILSEAFVLSNTTLKCPLPSWKVIQEIGPTIPLSVTSNGVDFVQSPTPLIYEDDDMIVVTKLYPLIGPAFGGTVVDIYGLGFQEGISYSCWFGKVSRAEYISDSHIQCTTPTSFVKESEQVLVVGLLVTSSLTPHPSDSSLNFTFYSQPTRLEMYPANGVSTGNTEIKIGSPELPQVLGKLQSLGTLLDPTCRFDTTVVPASLDYEQGYIICTSPPIETTLLNTTHAVPVSVSINGQDYISTYEQYHYYHPPSICSVAPDIVWVDEEAIELVIHGSNFLPLNQASCIVGEELIQADVVSSSEIRCLVQNLIHTDQVVPVSVSLNGGVDSSNVLPLSCRVDAPMILSANPLFVSEAGGTTVELQGSGFDQIKSSGLIKLNDALVPLSVIDNTTASFDAPSGEGTLVIQISYYGSTFVDTGFELQYLPPLHISSVKPAFVVADTENRVTISVSFGGEWNYKCVLTFGDDDLLEYIPSYVNETSMSCDIDLVGASDRHSSIGHIAVYREEDDQTSNALNIYTTPRYAIESVDPSVLSEAQANAGGQLIAIQSSQEVVVSAAPFFCRFTDSIGITTKTSADIITAHELRCTIPPLTGGTQVCLTREDGTVQSNSIELAVYPTCELVKLIPSSGPLSGGTNVTVQGIGFSAYSDVDILCQFGYEISAARIMDDEHIHCKTPSSNNNNVTFSLAQASQYGNISIINKDLSFQYYSQPKIVTITPDNGPASGGHEISLHIEDLTDIGKSFTLSFTSVVDQSHVTYTKDVKLLNQSTLQITTPPSPTGNSDGGLVVIRISGNGQDYSTDGVYYNYTESAVLHSFYPSEVVEGSCFNLTMQVDRLYTSPSHCVIGDDSYSASNGEVVGTVTCKDVCLDVHEGPYQVGLILDNDIFLPSSNDIQVRRRINAEEMTPFMGPNEGGTLVTIGGEFQEWSSQLYCFFGEYSTLATALNDTAIQCSTPPISMLKEDLLEEVEDNLLGVKVYVASSYHHQSMTRDDITNSMVFNYYEKEVIDSITPRSGSEEGGTAMQVYGSGFINTTSLTCKFGGEVEIQAAFLNNEHIMCTSPPLSDVAASQALPMSVPMMVSNNNEDYVSAGSFVYHAIPQIIRLSPAIGPAQTSVRLHSKSSLGWVEHLVCRFGGIVTTNVTVVSDYEVECVLPVAEHLGEAQNVEVEISLNGVDFFTSGHSFQYTNQPIIYSMSPVYGPITGGNAIVLHGKSLVFSQDNLVCHFGESQTISLSVSESTITCIAPASTKHGIIPFGIVTKDTNVVLEQYHDDTVIQYTYLPPVFVSSLHPSFGSTSGGTLLSITVKEEVPSVDELYCVFGGSTTTIALIDKSNRSFITCLTPHSNTIGSISIGIAQDQRATPTLLTTSDVQFRYTTDPTINDLYPRRGSSNSETNITLIGSNLLQGDINSVVCKVGSHELPATFLSNEDVKCTAPPDIPIREIQAITVIRSNEDESSSRASFTLGFKGKVSDPINIDSSVDAMSERLLGLPGLDDISISIEDESSLDKTFLVTFLGMVQEHQPFFTVEHTTVDVHIDRRQSLCCNVSLSLNGGVDFYDTELVFVYHDKVVVTGVTPDHGSTNGGTDVELSMLGISSSSSSQEDAFCIFGSVEVQGTWMDEETISCVSPASLDDATVAVGVKFSSGARAESMATFTYHHEPEILSIFPLSLPALHASKALDVYGMHFYESESMTCIFDVSLPSEGGGGALEDGLATYRELATFHNSSHIQCPDPPILQSFYSNTDQSWASNSTLVEGSMLSISLESGSDSHYIGAMPFHALVETTSLFPETGPRKGGTEVVVEGINMMNTTHLTCQFGSVVGPLAQYISPTKVLCITPHYPDGYGRAVVPIQVALNGVDFSSTSNDVMFEYHEPLSILQVDPMASLPKGGSTINVELDDESMGFSALHENSPDMIVSHLDPPYGPKSGGNVVTIIGQGFTANHATTCSFGGITITASYVSEESLSCVAPQAVEDDMLVDVVISVDNRDDLIGGQYIYLPIK